MLWRASMVNREIWVHPLNLDCEKKGEFYTLYPDLRNFKKEFFHNGILLFEVFRFSSTSFLLIFVLNIDRVSNLAVNADRNKT